MPPNWRPPGPKSLEDEAPVRRKPVAPVGSVISDLFPESESALRNGLARTGDRRVLEYAAEHDLVLVSTDSDFERLLMQVPAARVVILRSCDYPTEIAAYVLRRNAICIVELLTSQTRLIILDR